MIFSMYSLLLLSIVCATSNNVLLHIIKAKNIKYNPFLFNATITFIWLLFFLLINLGFHNSSSNTFIFGLVYGFLLLGFIYFKSMAMTTGPIAITALIGCSSFILTTIFNAIYWKESTDIYEILGIILMILSIFLINFKFNKKSIKVELSLKWKIFSILFFIFSGLIGIIFRFHQSIDKENTNEMMILASIISTIGLITINLINVFLKHDIDQTGNIQVKNNEKLIILFIAIFSGIFSSIYNRLNIYNVGIIPSVLFFPIFNGGVVISSFLFGWLTFNEKPTKIQIVGLTIGIIAITFISRFFGIL